jgi:hypothetical protein
VKKLDVPPGALSLFPPSDADCSPSAPSLKTRGTLKPKALISRRISGFPKCFRHWNRFSPCSQGDPGRKTPLRFEPQQCILIERALAAKEPLE